MFSFDPQKNRKSRKTWKSRNVAKPLYCRQDFEITAISLDVFFDFFRTAPNKLPSFHDFQGPPKPPDREKRSFKGHLADQLWLIKLDCFERVGKNTKKSSSEPSSFICQDWVGRAETHARASRPLRSPQPAHNNSLDKSGFGQKSGF